MEPVQTVETSPPYQQTLNYPAWLLSRLWQITNIWDMGGSGIDELNTLWTVLLLEVKEDIQEEYTTGMERLKKLVDKEPKGTIWVASEKRYISHQERVYRLEIVFVKEMVSKIVERLHAKRLLLISGKEVEIGGYNV